MSDLTDEEIVKALCEIEEGLTEWELKFVDDQGRRLDLPRQAGFPFRFRSYNERLKALQILKERG